MWLSCCIDHIQDPLVCLITCNIQELCAKAVVAAYNSLTTCPPNFLYSPPIFFLSLSPQLFLAFIPTRPSLFLTPSTLKQLFYFLSLRCIILSEVTPPPHFSVSPENDSIPEASTRKCRRATLAISTNHSDLSCTPRS